MNRSSSNHPQPRHQEGNRGEFSWELSDNTLIFQGNLVLSNLDNVWKTIHDNVKKMPSQELIIDLESVGHIDSAGIAFLQILRKMRQKQQKRTELQRVPGHIEETIEKFSLEIDFELPEPEKKSFIEKIGKRTYQFFTVDLSQYVSLMADSMFWAVTDLFIHRYRRKGEVINQIVLIGTNAIPIILLISFLIGLVLTLQSAAQLRQFGANIYVADLIVISMTREMGPLITAIVLAGRSGSAIASEIGTMVVTEEIDALKVMAINPVRYLVIPKLYATIFVLPILALMSILIASFGAMIIGYLYLDITPVVFYGRIEDAILFTDILTGLAKSIIFAGIIVITGSHYGFNVKGGGEAVGRNTTASVVTAIFLVILADSILGLFFYFEA